MEKGFQKELPDIWLTDGNPWEVKRPEIKYEIAFGGRTEKRKENGKEVTVWVPNQKVRTVLDGHRATVVLLRLWC